MASYHFLSKDMQDRLKIIIYEWLKPYLEDFKFDQLLKINDHFDDHFQYTSQEIYREHQEMTTLEMVRQLTKVCTIDDNLISTINSNLVKNPEPPKKVINDNDYDMVISEITNYQKTLQPLIFLLT